MHPRDKAHQGLDLMKAAILEVIRDSERGLTNADVAELLEIRSDYQGSQKDYLSWSILGLLLNEGKVRRTGRRYVLDG